MNKKDLVEMLARNTQVSPAVAADELDRLVTRILKDLRRRNPVELPGLGVLTPARRAGQEIPIVPFAARKRDAK
jgi:nucleoid DNA-binding protein